MHTVFLLNRSNNFRFFAPTINFLKIKNIEITLIKYEADIYKNTSKDYLNPSNLKSEILSNINLVKINTFEEVQKYLVKNLSNFDYIFSIDFLEKDSCVLNDSDLNKILDKWCVISHGMDSIISLNPEKIYFSKNTKFFFTSKYMYEHGLEYLYKYNKVNNFSNFQNYFFVGNSFYDKEIFTKKNISGQKKLVYLPFPFSRDRKGQKEDFAFQAAFTGKNINLLKINKKFKNKNITATILYEYFKHKVAVNFELLKYYKNIKKYLYLYNEKNIIINIRKFCDKNNYKFICKPRLKFPFNNAIFEYADEIIYDEEENVYPTRLQKLLQKTDLIIGSLSSTIFEAAMFGIPYLNIEIPSLAFSKNKGTEFWHNYKLGHYYNFPGVIYSLSIKKFLEEFENKDPQSFLIDSFERARYLEKFCGVLLKKDFNVGKNIYNYLKKN